MKRIILLISVVCFIPSFLFSQEILSGLQYNPVIKDAVKKEIQQNNAGASRRLELIKPITLPFFDDFHQKSIFPDTSRWLDRDVYVNQDFPYRSVNVGAATFDAIDEYGNLYPEASSFPFIADILNSKPIRLDSVFDPVPREINISDSVFFSFFYQPQGRGNKPEPWDSLVLQFGYPSGDSVFVYYDSIPIPISSYIQPGDTIYPLDTLFAPSYCDSNKYLIADRFYVYGDTVQMPCKDVFIPEYTWNTVWSTEGMALDTLFARYGTYCRQILIPITDSATYFRKDFMFRFFNYASLSTQNVPSWRSNTDQWNVDYIYLNIGRSESDTTYRDISFVERAPTMLRRYQAMPYSQYKNDPTNSMADSINLVISNLYDEAFNTDYGYYVDATDGSYSFYHDGGGCNLPPFYSFGYQKCDETCGASRACPIIDFIYPLGFGKDSAAFEIKHVISGFTAADTVGDTLSFNQEFYNYFAYDDGTPEAGYGINIGGGKVAYRFQLNQRDSLRAIRMFFNRTEGNANDQYFDLAVWRDNNGEPGELLYKEVDLKPKFSNSLYKIQTYYLEEPVAINNVFYIGWIQSTDDNLNVGFDTYNDASSNIFYNVYGYWEKTAFTGSIIMRPVIGEAFDPFDIQENTEPNVSLHIYPNPSGNGIFHIEAEDHSQLSLNHTNLLEIYNLTGQRILIVPFNKTLDASSLADGFYIIRVTDKSTGRAFSGKIMINR